DPRPGEVAEFARAGNLIDLSKFISNDDLTKSFGQAYIDLGKVDGKQVGILFKANSKSTFWYKPASFQQLGVQPPKTLDELFTIADKYKAAGKTPFAVGGKDGWVLTDYFENIMARVATPQQYNDLHMTHKLAWTDPTVKKALTQLARFFQSGYVPGGSQGVLGTQFVDSISQVFGANAKAEMFYEGGFVGVIATTDVNKSLKPEQDIDFFMFPQVDPQFGDPVIGGGDTAMMFKDSPESRQFMQYLISKEAADVFAATNTISPNKQVDLSKFPSPLARKESQQLANAKVFLFDGSDLAPSSLGGDFEFTKLQDLVGKPGDVDRIAQELENFAKTAYQ
ncbi:MAG: extracellular solute-binding protein, partial [Chloroflexi bacterium]|nr:extracellular solute-binding protein [Chloroflexota bacterium]